MIRNFLQDLSNHSNRHAREGLKIIMAGIIGGKISTADLSVAGLIEVIIFSIFAMGLLIVMYELLEYLYGRPKYYLTFLNDKKPPQVAK